MENCGHKLQTSLCCRRYLHNTIIKTRGQSNLHTLSMDDSNLLFHSSPSKFNTLNPSRSEKPLIRQVKPRACNWYEVTREQLRFSLIVSKGPEECLFFLPPHIARTLETNLIECLFVCDYLRLESVSGKSGGDMWKWGVFDADQCLAALPD